MPNKHQIQKDFYTKMSEWKENYKVNTETQNEENKKEEHQKLILRESCFKGIDGARIESMAFKDTPEHKSIVEEANKRIEEGRRREAKAYNDAKYYFGR